jgi:hypothetical protein
LITSAKRLLQHNHLKATELLRGREMTRSAICRHAARQQRAIEPADQSATSDFNVNIWVTLSNGTYSH